MTRVNWKASLASLLLASWLLSADTSLHAQDFSILEDAPATSAAQEPESLLPPPAPTNVVGSEPPSTADPGDFDAALADASQPTAASRTQATELGYDLLLQGPVHEAFAVVDAPRDLEQQPTIPLPPPAAIDEQPPELDGPLGNKQWIPGYWAWDDQLDDFVWVSGLYREVPPGRVWAPGYWEQVAGGYQWVGGYWADARLQHSAQRPAPEANLNYLPAPPASIDNGPSSPPPRSDTFWYPGEWQYNGQRYAWHAGYWSQQYPNWIWQPACYLYTPRGYVYVSGYWDYEPEVRGICYAPVVFPSTIYRRPGYVFRPAYRLAQNSVLLLHLFARPGHRWYYYGNYYGDYYTSRGYYPWYNVRPNSFGTTSLLAYYNWKYRQYGLDFSNSMSRYQHYYHDHGRGSPGNVQRAGGGANRNAQYALYDPLLTNMNSLDQIVRRELAGKPPQRLDPRSAGLPSRDKNDGFSGFPGGQRGGPPSGARDVRSREDDHANRGNPATGRSSDDRRAPPRVDGPRVDGPRVDGPRIDGPRVDGPPGKSGGSPRGNSGGSGKGKSGGNSASRLPTSPFNGAFSGIAGSGGAPLPRSGSAAERDPRGGPPAGSGNAQGLAPQSSRALDPRSFNLRDFRSEDIFKSKPSFERDRDQGRGQFDFRGLPSGGLPGNLRSLTPSNKNAAAERFKSDRGGGGPVQAFSNGSREALKSRGNSDKQRGKSSRGGGGKDK